MTMTGNLLSTPWCCSSTLSSQNRKRIRSQTRCNPWRDTWELEEVGRALLHAANLLDTCYQRIEQHAEQDLQNALSRVAVWKTRSDLGRIPHSVETTAALAEVLWRDFQGLGSSTMELRLTYSAALLRGVNGIADVMQNQRGTAASVASLCEMVGLPGWLVDMRHDAAHNDLPPLPALRLAAKTFLGFLQERYWAPMTTKRSKEREEAFKILQDYREAAKKSSTSSGSSSTAMVMSHPGNESSDDDSSESDDPDDGKWGKSVGTNQNRFAALFEVRKKPSSKIETKSPKEKKPNTPTDDVQLRHASHFVKAVSIDVGFQMALSFLIWGGMGDLKAGDGVLISESCALYPASAEGVDGIRKKYKPLLQTMCGAWPGFAVALLVHLVDCILCIEHDNDHSDNDQGRMDNESSRKLFFLASWVRFLVSREFHLRGEPSVGRINQHSRNLAKRPECEWTKEERFFLQKPAPLEVLRRAQFPLNSLCDRCDGADNKDSHLSETSSTIAKLFNDILGDSRTRAMGVTECLSSLSEPQTAGRDRKRQKPSLKAKEDAVQLMSEGVSLAKMQVLPPISDNEAKRMDSVDQPSPEDVENAQSQASNIVPAWIQCETWDACAIGTLPGYPV